MLSYEFLLFALVASLTPGPNNIMITTSGLNFGWRASMPHFWGICLGFPTMFLAVGFGLGFILEQYPLVHTFIKILGILYLLYLAWLTANATSISIGEKVSKPLTFLQAALFQWINPKAWLSATSAIAAYAQTDHNLKLQIISMALVFLLVAIIAVAVWLFMGVSLQKLIHKPRLLKTFNITMALLLVISVLPVIREMII